jgi:hypothetical protein
MDAIEAFGQFLCRLGMAKHPLTAGPKGLHHRLPLGGLKQHNDLDARMKQAGFAGQLEAPGTTFEVAADKQNVEWLIRQQRHDVRGTGCYGHSGKAP